MRLIDPEKLKLIFQQNYMYHNAEIIPLKNNHVFLVKEALEHEQFVIKIYEEEKMLHWQDRFIEQMSERETKGLIPFIKNKYQTSINKLPDNDYVFGVMPYIPGEAINPQNWKEVVDCLRLLAHFHAQGSGIYGKQQVIPFRSKLLDKWTNRLQLFIRSLQPYPEAKTLETGEDNINIQDLILSRSKEYIHWAEWTLVHFPTSYILYLEEQAQWERQIAHLDVAPHNFLTIYGQYYYLFDYDLADYSPPLFDLIQFINRILNEYEWDYDQMLEMINVYDKYRQLQTMEKKIIPILLVYPNDLFREWLGLWRNQGGFHSEKVYQYFKSLDSNWSRRQLFVEKCKQSWNI